MARLCLYLVARLDPPVAVEIKPFILSWFSVKLWFLHRNLPPDFLSFSGCMRRLNCSKSLDNNRAWYGFFRLMRLKRVVLLLINRVVVLRCPCYKSINWLNILKIILLMICFLVII